MTGRQELWTRVGESSLKEPQRDASTNAHPSRFSLKLPQNADNLNHKISYMAAYDAFVTGTPCTAVSRLLPRAASSPWVAGRQVQSQDCRRRDGPGRQDDDEEDLSA
jgi:hypothetical protein